MAVVLALTVVVSGSTAYMNSEIDSMAQPNSVDEFDSMKQDAINKYNRNNPVNAIIDLPDGDDIIDFDGDPEIGVPPDYRDVYYENDPYDLIPKSNSIPTDDSDPLAFSFGEMTVERAWPEWNDSRKEFVDIGNGTEKALSRVLGDGTMLLVIDGNRDGKLSDINEMMMHNNYNVYEMMFYLDSDNNGWFDYADDGWNLALIKDGKTYHTTQELGILAFNYDNHIKSKSDMHGNSRYSDCIYEGKLFYDDCDIISENHFRYSAYNPESILFVNGTLLDSFGIVQGILSD